MFDRTTLLGTIELSFEKTWERFIKKVGLFLLVGLVLFLSLYQLETYPTIWFDEGWWLQLPKNLVLYGQYATRSSEGFRPFDTVVSVSPVFTLPIAVMFKLWGVGLLQARLVIVMYFWVTCWLMYAVTRKLFGVTTALIALGLLIFVQPDDELTSALLMGRQVMGEVPALCFLMAGIYCWLNAFERHKWLLLTLSGIGFGLAVSIKTQFIVAVLPVWIVLAVVDRFYYGQRRYLYYVWPMFMLATMLALNQLYVYWLLGAENFAKYLADYYAASGPQVRVLFTPRAMIAAFKLLVRSDYIMWVIPALIYSVGLCLRKQPSSIRLCLIGVLVGGWLVWFLFASVGWARYTFPMFAISHILVAKLIVDLASAAAPASQTWQSLWKQRDGVAIARWVSIGAVLLIFLANSSRTILVDVFSAPDYGPQQFAAYLDTNIGPETLIETWEWEIAFLSQPHNYHHPPTPLLNQLIAKQQLGMPYDPQSYQFQQLRPTYVLIGPFAKWTRLYPADFLENQCTLVISLGGYNLYKVNTNSN